MGRYEALEAFKKSHALVLRVYRSTAAFPSDERYGLTSQCRRAAFSITANLVEGSSRRGAREFRRFLQISIASLAELEYALRLARDLGYLDNDLWREVDIDRDLVGKLMWGLLKSMNRAVGQEGKGARG